jgi:crotonobetaine/carnitine-CoA ligase
MAEMTGYDERMTGLGSTRLTHVFAAPITGRFVRLMEGLGATFVTNYNSTETNSPIGSVGYDPVPIGSCGRMREGVEYRLVDEAGNDVEPGAAGELLIRTPDRFAMHLGYWGMPDATAKAWKDGWFHTGDLLRVDDDGYWYIPGRLKDRIRVRGENVNPDELEMVVNTCPAVTSSGAVGRPLEEGEDEIVLFVVPAIEAPVTDEVLAHCKAQLPKFMWPVEVIEVQELPATPTGKIQRAVLRDHLTKERVG